MNKTLILVVEDDRPIRNLIVTTLKTHDYKYLAASYSDIYFADHHHINPSGDSVSSETEYDYGLSDPFMQLYRKQSS